MPLDVTYMTLHIPLGGKMLTFITCRGKQKEVIVEGEICQEVNRKQREG